MLLVLPTYSVRDDFFFWYTILWEVLYMYIIWYQFDFVYDYGIDFCWILHMTIITKI